MQVAKHSYLLSEVFLQAFSSTNTYISTKGKKREKKIYIIKSYLLLLLLFCCCFVFVLLFCPFVLRNQVKEPSADLYQILEGKLSK